ncbi:MAG: helix-turn-helix domain-containing protein [Deltaproteobacteria bacterium]|jgi:transcriptional regulator with XRE-family HTH domain|nr:helix-turn-helix domain-containing protein [Deltaproteobacteria bacterium]
MPKTKDIELFKHIGLRLRIKRLELKIPKEKIAELLNIDSLQIWKYEKGSLKIPIDYLFKISKYFNISLDYFIEGYQTGSKSDLVLMNQTKENVKIEKKIQIIKQIYASSDTMLIEGIETCLSGYLEKFLKKQNKQKRNPSPVQKKRLTGNSKS